MSGGQPSPNIPNIPTALFPGINASNVQETNVVLFSQLVDCIVLLLFMKYTLGDLLTSH